MKDKEKIEINKIEIKIGEKLISLKPEQARELSKVLRELLGEETKNEIQTVQHHYHTSSYPVYVYRDHWQWYGTPCWSPAITCGTTGSLAQTATYSGSALNSGNTFTLALQNAA